MRATSIAIVWLGIAQPAICQDVDMIVRVSADGMCYAAKITVKCSELGSRLISKHLVPKRHVCLNPDSGTGIEVFKVAEDSLRKSGIDDFCIVGSSDSPPHGI
jgi:biopolymer transport protein ExbD